MPRVTANITLLTEQNKEITTHSISTHSWDEDTKFELPLEMIQPIQKIAAALEHVIVEHMKDSQLKLS